MSSGNTTTALAQLFEDTFKSRPEFRLYISSYLDFLKQNNPHFDEAQISLAEQNLWSEFYRQCLTAMGEVSFDCLAILNNQAHVLGMNKMAERVLGHSFEELQNQSVFDTFFTDLQRKEYQQCFQEGLKDPTNKMFKQRWELVLSKPNGSIFPIELSLSRLKLFGSEVLIASFKDVTKQKWTFDALQFNEERYRKIVQDSSDAIFLIDPESKQITEANTAFSVLLGYNSDELYSLNLYDLMEGEHEKINEWVDFKRFRGTELLVREELNLLRRDNEWMEVEISCSLFEQRERQILCLVARDTSERKILKRPRLIMEKLQKTDLVDALQEINILLEELKPNKNQKETVLQINSLHQHICELIEVALPPVEPAQLTMIDNSAKKLPKQSFSLRAVANSLKFLFHHTASSRGLQIFHSVEEDVPDSFISEPNRLQHILYQLLDNALRHTEEGNILLKVRMAQEEDNAVTLLFMVRDTGLGISEDTQLGIRTLFEEGRILEHTDFKGLLAAKQYIDDLNGRIWFNSLPGQGSTFLFNLTLPLSEAEQSHLPDFDPEIPPPDFIQEEVAENNNDKQAEAAPLIDSEEESVAEDWAPEIEAEETAVSDFSELENSLEQEPVQASTQATLQSSPNIPLLPPEALEGLEPSEILLVDDDLQTMLDFQQFLSGYPVIFSFVENGRKACDMVKDRAFDLILMDLSMPVMDGKTATRQIRKWENSEDRAPTLIIGLKTEEDTEENCEAFSAIETKPQKKEILLRLLCENIPLWSEHAALLALDQAQDTASTGTNEAESEEVTREYDTSPETNTQDNPETSEPQNEKIIVQISLDMLSHAPPFLAKRQQDLLKIEQALSQDDFGLVRVLGKSMKSAGGIYGFVGIAEIGEAFELAASNGDKETIDSYLEKLRSYLSLVEIVVEDSDSNPIG
jgi:PAS domain S-box-containing protein